VRAQHRLAAFALHQSLDSAHRFSEARL